ncbi:MASE1 domain-containing protein [Microcoleus sp. herbarium2]|uniref:MASE1 domain-containing protein n=1 Tax=Microcoleus sp. herbarium2 TaxID=3055433 RepID=UPI002FD47D15
MQTKFLNAIKGHSWRYFLVVGAIALTYYWASQFAISTLNLSSAIYPMWPAAGIAQAALLVFGRQLWPGIAIGGFLFSMSVPPANIATALISAAARTLQAWTGTYLLQRTNFSAGLDRLKDVLAIVGLAVLGSTLINSTIGSIVVCLTDLSSCGNLGRIWGSWWVGDAMGILLVAPLLLTWQQLPTVSSPRKKIAERAIWLLLLLAVGWLVFCSRTRAAYARYPLEYLPFPLVVWAAFRFGQRYTALSNFVLCGFAIWGIARGSGPFLKHASSIPQALLSLQAFIAVIAVTGLVLAATVAERHQAEASLRSSEQRFSKAFHASPVGISICTLTDGCFLDANESFLRSLGWRRHEFIGRTARDLGMSVNSEDEQHLAQILQAQNSIGNQEIKIRTKGGEVRDWLLSVELIYLDSTECVLIMTSDITEHLRSEEFRRAALVAEAANRSKSIFLANMSHELRTPLNPIIVYSQTLQEDARDLGAEEFIDDLKAINTAGKRLLTLIERILDLTKIEAGDIELRLETFTILNLVEQVVATIEPMAERKKNILEIQCPKDIGSMRTDKTKLRQSLVNLLSNASKFTCDGTITFAVTRSLETPAEAAKGGKRLEAYRGDCKAENTLSSSQEWIVFTIKDTGIGMSPEQLARIFEPFMQVDSSSTKKYGGAGLGLTITKEFCEMMGGEITAFSELDKGSTFTIRLPAIWTDSSQSTENSDKQ